MNSCPDIETLIEFAYRPIAEENADIAAHVYTCPGCCTNLDIANLVIDADQYDITTTDLNLSVQLVNKVIQKKAWNYLGNVIQQIAELLKNKVFITNPEFEQAFYKGFTKKSLFAASAKSKKSKITSPIIISFISNEDEHSQYYWQAELAMPVILSKTSLLTFKITDKNGSPVRKGKLIFQNIELDITAGIATISFSAFKESVGNPGTIALRFSDSYLSNGMIQFWDK